MDSAIVGNDDGLIDGFTVDFNDDTVVMIFDG